MEGLPELYGKFTTFYGAQPGSWLKKTRTRESWQSCWHNRILNRLAVWFVYKAWKLETRLLLETRNWNTINAPHGDQAGGKVIHMVKDESVTRITLWFFASMELLVYLVGTDLCLQYIGDSRSCQQFSAAVPVKLTSNQRQVINVSILYRYRTLPNTFS